MTPLDRERRAASVAAAGALQLLAVLLALFPRFEIATGWADLPVSVLVVFGATNVAAFAVAGWAMRQVRKARRARKAARARMGR